MHLHDEFKFPFALTVGSGLGLSYSSLRQVGPLLPTQTIGQARVQMSVNAANGNLVVQDRNIQVADLNDHVSISYLYNSMDKEKPWRLQIGRSIQFDAKTNCLTVMEADGHEVIYTQGLDGNYYAPAHEEGTPYIIKTKQGFTWTHPATKEEEIFDEKGNLLAHLDEYRNKTEYHIRPGHIEIHLPSGARYRIEKNVNETKVFYNEILLNTYLFENNYLKQSTAHLENSKTYETIYTYQAGSLEGIQQSDTTQLAFEFKDEKLSKLTLGTEANYEFNYTTSTCDITEPNQSVISLTHENGLIRSLKQASDEIQYQHENGRIKHIIYPDGTKESFHYDERGLCIEHVNRDETIDEYKYSLIAGKNCLTAHIKYSPVLNIRRQTSFVYDTVEHHGILIPVRCFEISPEGRVTEFQRDQRGLIETERNFLNNFFKDAAFTLENLHTWKKSISLSKTALKAFHHEPTGQIHEEIAYNTLDENGRGMASNHQKKKYKYDNLRHQKTLTMPMSEGKIYCEEQETNTIGQITKLTLGKGSLDPQLSTSLYAGDCISYTDATGKTTQHTFDASGHLAFENQTTEDGMSRTKIFERDAKGEMQRIQEFGQIRYEFYDNQHQLAATVSPEGEVCKFNYNQKYRYEMKTACKNTLPANITITKDAVHELPSSDEDRISYTFYDCNNKPIYLIDAEGYIIENRYDSFGDLINEIKYKQKLTDEDRALLLTGGKLSRELTRDTARIHTFLYDQDHKKIAEKDAAGYITRYVLNAGGSIENETHFATPDLAINIDLTALTTNEQDATLFYEYNNLGQRIKTTNAEGNVTTFTYYPNGKIASEIHHSNFGALNNEINETKETRYYYDIHNRTIKVTYSNGKVKEITYNKANQPLEHISHDGNKLIQEEDNEAYRARQTRYDNWGEVKAEANEFVAKQLALAEIELSANELALKVASIWNEHALQYQYDDNGLKISATNELGKTTHYFYDKNRRPVLTIDPRGAIIETTYNSFGDITSKTKYYHRLTKEQLDTLKGGYKDASIIELIRKNADKDRTIEYVYNKNGLCEEKIDAEKNTAYFEHNAFGECEKEYIPIDKGDTKEECLLLHRQFEARGHETSLTKSRKGKSVKTSKKYEHYKGLETERVNEVGCKITTERDRLGRDKKITTTIEEGRALVQEKAYDAFDRIKSTTIAGQTTNLTYCADGKEVTITKPNGNKETRQSNIFDECIKLSKGDHTELFSHAPDGQPLSYSNGVAEEFKDYYLNGKKKLETKFSGSKTSYRLNDAGDVEEKIEDENGLNLSHQFETNAFGEAEKITNFRGVVQRNDFDRNAVLTQQIDDETGLNITHNKTVNAQGLITDTVLGDHKIANQMHTRNTYDELGRENGNIVDPEEPGEILRDNDGNIVSALNLQTIHTLDAAGQRIKTVNPKGEQTYYYRNLLGQVRFEVTEIDDGLFAVTEFQYTDTGKEASVRKYTQPLEAEQIQDSLTLSDIKNLVTSSPQDSLTKLVYDANENVRFKLTYNNNAEGRHIVIEEKQYDQTDREIIHHRYAKPYLIKKEEEFTLSKLEQIVLDAASDQDRAKYTIYDKANQEIYKIESSGRVTEKRYNPNGKVIQETVYDASNIALPALLKASPEKLATLLKTCEKRSTYHVYDNLDREIFLVKPNGAVIGSYYNDKKHTKTICKFNDFIELTEDYQELVNELNKLSPITGYDNIHIIKSDNVDREYITTDALGNTDTYVRNAKGSVDTYTNREGKCWDYKHDRGNRRIFEISPETNIAVVNRDPQTNKLSYSLLNTRVSKKVAYDEINNINEIIEAHGLSNKKIFITNYYPGSKLKNTIIKDATIFDRESPIESPRTKTEDITTSISYNSQGKLVTYLDEENRLSYSFYDASGELVYELKQGKALIKYIYNSFGEVLHEIHYATSYDISASKLTIASIEAFIEKNKCKNDRIIEKFYDQAGQLTETRTSAIFYYSNGKYGIAQPIARAFFNIFEECFLEQIRINEDDWASTSFWSLDNGRTLININAENHVVVYYFNSAGKEEYRTEYAQPIAVPEINLSGLSKEEMQKLRAETILAAIQKHPNDLHFKSVYDANGEKVKDIQLQVQPYQIKMNEADLPEFNSNEVKDIVTEYKLNKLQQVIITTLPNGSQLYNYYDERGLQIANTGPTFTEAVTKEKITPLTISIPDAHGKMVVQQQSPEGCHLPEEDIVPVFKNLNSVQEHIIQPNERSLPIVEQDPEGNVTIKGYNKRKKTVNESQVVTLVTAEQPHLAAKTEAAFVVIEDEAKTRAVDDDYEMVNENGATAAPALHTATGINPDPTRKATFGSKSVLDQVSLSYDDFDIPTRKRLIRVEDNTVDIQQDVEQKPNIFGEIIAERSNEGEWEANQTFNNSGQVLASNMDGVPTLRLTDLRSALTLCLKYIPVMPEDFDAIDPAIFLNNPNYKDIDFTKYDVDKLARVLRYYAPYWFKPIFEGKAPYPYPTASSQYNAWDKATKETNSSGHTTDNTYNHANLLKMRELPAVDVIDTDNNIIRIRPTTHFYHEIANSLIGMKDANGNLQAYIKDEAYNLISKVFADGMRDGIRGVNAFGLPNYILDPRNNRWQYHHNNNNQIKDVIYPNGGARGYRYNEKTLPNKIIEQPGEYITAINYDVDRNISERIAPAGESTKFKHAHNKLKIKEINPNQTSQAWERSHTGLELEYKDLSGNVIESIRHPITQRLLRKLEHKLPGERDNLRIERSLQPYKGDTDTNHLLTINKVVRVHAKPMDIEYISEYGVTKFITDRGLNQITEQRIDEVGIYEIVVSDIDGNVISDRSVERDELERPSIHHETHYPPRQSGPAKLLLKIIRDAGGNIRSQLLTLKPAGHFPTDVATPHTRHAHNTFDEQSRIRVAHGVLKDATKGPEVSPGQGVEYTYAQDIRSRETRMAPDGNTIIVDIKMDASQHLSESYSNQKYQVTITYEPNYRKYTIVETDLEKNEVTTTNLTYTANGWIFTDIKTNSKHPHKPTSSRYDYPLDSDHFGQPSVQVVDEQEHGRQIHFRLNYYSFNIFMLSDSKAILTQHGRDGEESKAELLYNSVRGINGKVSSEDEPGNVSIKTDVSFNSITSGEVLDKIYISDDHAHDPYPNQTSTIHYMLSLEGEILASYYELESTHLQTRYLENIRKGKGEDVNLEPVIQDLRIAPPVLSVGKPTPQDPAQRNDHLPSDLDTSFIPKLNCLVEYGDTLESIAKRELSEVEGLFALQRENGFFGNNHHLIPGMPIKLPHYIACHFRDDAHPNYNNFLSTVIGNLSPYLLPPVIKVNLLEVLLPELLEVIALGVMFMVAPHIATFLLTQSAALGLPLAASGAASAGVLGTVSSGLAHTVLTGVVVGIGNAATQGIAVKAGMQKHVDLFSVVESAITAGTIDAMQALGANLAKQLIAVAVTSTATQVIGLKLGHRFDASAIVTQIFATFAAAQIDNGLSYLQGGAPALIAQSASVVLNSGVNAVLGSAASQTKVNVPALATHALGNIAAEGMAGTVQAAYSNRQKAARATVLNPRYAYAGQNHTPAQRSVKQQSYTPFREWSEESSGARQRTASILESSYVSHVPHTDNYGKPATSSNSTNVALFGGLKNKIMNSYLSPEEWSAASIDSLSKEIEILGSAYKAKALQAAAYSKRLFGTPVRDTIAAESGSDIGLKLSKAQHHIANNLHNAGEQLTKFSIFAKRAMFGLSVADKTIETLQAPPQQRSRVGFEKAAELIGEIAGGFGGTLLTEFTLPATLGTSLFVMPATIIATASVGGYYGVKLAKEAETMFERINNKF